MKPKKHKTDLTDLDLEATRKIAYIIAEAVGEAVQHVFEMDDTYIYFPADGDPMTMDLCLHMGADGDWPTFEFSLSDVVDRFIKDSTGRGGFDAGAVGQARALSAGFKALAARLDQV